jgi:P-type conjugative transfer protein TrbJ
VAYYRSSPCFSSAGCSDAELAAIQQNRILASESQKKANDALFRGLDRQQDALRADARTLEQLQSGAQGATGRMQAIQNANQLASEQANQLLQIRGLLIAQQNAIVTRNQALADREAQEAAASEQLRMGTFQKSAVVNW